jgi:hypothetical protein
MEKAKALLRDQQMAISDVAQFIGYSNTGSLIFNNEMARVVPKLSQRMQWHLS